MNQRLVRRHESRRKHVYGDSIALQPPALYLEFGVAMISFAITDVQISVLILATRVRLMMRMTVVLSISLELIFGLRKAWGRHAQRVAQGMSRV